MTKHTKIAGFTLSFWAGVSISSFVLGFALVMMIHSSCEPQRQPVKSQPKKDTLIVPTHAKTFQRVEVKDTLADTIFAVKELAFRRETAYMPFPYKVHVWDNYREYFGKYGFNRLAINAFCGLPEKVQMPDYVIPIEELFLESPQLQELAMTNLCRYCADKLKASNLPATVRNIWLCHVCGDIVAVQMIKTKQDAAIRKILWGKEDGK